MRWTKWVYIDLDNARCDGQNGFILTLIRTDMRDKSVYVNLSNDRYEGQEGFIWGLY